MFKDVEVNEHGFYVLKQIPTKEELEAFYRDSYYQNLNATINKSPVSDVTADESPVSNVTADESPVSNVTADESPVSDVTADESPVSDVTADESPISSNKSVLDPKLEQKYLLIKQHLPEVEHYDFLDVGCGPGACLNFFKNKNNFTVLGLDYSIYGAEQWYPSICENMIVGDIYESFDTLISSKKSFNIINIDCVLEHLEDPTLILKKSIDLMKKDSIAIIQVPNDFSPLQQHLYESGRITEPSWVRSPDHLSYFNKDGLINLCKSVGLEVVDMLGDHFIEFSAFNDNTNYFKNKSVGSSCHLASVEIESFLWNISNEKTLQLYRAFMDMGIGRRITGVFKKS